MRTSSILATAWFYIQFRNDRSNCWKFDRIFLREYIKGTQVKPSSRRIWSTSSATSSLHSGDPSRESYRNCNKRFLYKHCKVSSQKYVEFQIWLLKWINLDFSSRAIMEGPPFPEDQLLRLLREWAPEPSQLPPDSLLSSANWNCTLKVRDVVR